MVEPLAESCQHVPQPGDANPVTANDPPMLGNVGIEPNVGNDETRFEQETISKLLAASSYTVSNVAVSVTAKAEPARRRTERIENFIAVWLDEE